MAERQPRKRSARNGVTKRQRDGYLDALRDGCTVRQAAERVGKHRGSFEFLRRTDPEFSALHDEAYEAGADVLEAEAFRRAVTGVDDVKMIGQGSNAERVEFRNYSDRLLELLLKAKRPKVYRENVKVEQVGKDDGPLEVEHSVKGVRLTDVLDLANRIGPAPSSNDD